jgi:hypothetical protein
MISISLWGSIFAISWLRLQQTGLSVIWQVNAATLKGVAMTAAKALIAVLLGSMLSG